MHKNQKDGFHPAIDAMRHWKKIIPGHRQVLLALYAELNENSDYSFLNFKEIGEATGMIRRDVKRNCRALAAKGLIVFSIGLTTEDGRMAGSGYAITDQGIIVAKLLTE